MLNAITGDSRESVLLPRTCMGAFAINSIRVKAPARTLVGDAFYETEGAAQHA